MPEQPKKKIGVKKQPPPKNKPKPQPKKPAPFQAGGMY